MRRIKRAILKVVVVLTILTTSSLVNMNSGLTAVTVSADDLSEIDIQEAKKVKLLQGKALLEARTVLIRRPAYRSGRLERPLTNDDLSNLVNLKNGINVAGDQITPQSITDIGSYSIRIKLSSELFANVKIEILPIFRPDHKTRMPKSLRYRSPLMR